MERQKVESSNILEIGYSGGILEVKFKNGGIYHYMDVPRTVYDRLMQAESKGSFLHAQIKPNFKCRKGKAVII